MSYMTEHYLSHINEKIKRYDRCEKISLIIYIDENPTLLDNDKNTKITCNFSLFINSCVDLYIFTINYDVIYDVIKLLDHSIYSRIFSLKIEFDNITGSMEKIIHLLPNLKRLSVLTSKFYKGGKEFKLDICNKSLDRLFVENIIYLPNNLNSYFPNLISLGVIINNIDEFNILVENIKTKLEKLRIKIGDKAIPFEIDMNLFNDTNIKKLDIINDNNSFNKNTITCNFNNVVNKNFNLTGLSINNCYVLSINNINQYINIKNISLEDLKIETDYEVKLAFDNLVRLDIIANKSNKTLFKNVELIIPNATHVFLESILGTNEPSIIGNKIITLSLANNKIKCLSSRFFINLRCLENLLCDNNLIDTISSIISSCKKLRYLDLSNNKLTILPQNLKTVEYLYLNNNPLLTIDNIIFEELVDCHIFDTKITSIKLSYTPVLKQLKSIRCSHNITHIDKKIQPYIMYKGEI